jgi:hypothetical protein
MIDEDIVSINPLEQTDSKVFEIYQDCLKRGDEVSAEIILEYIMEFCPHKLKN